MEGRVHLGFMGYTSISRMQIYTDDYFSILEMLVRSSWSQTRMSQDHTIVCISLKRHSDCAKCTLHNRGHSIYFQSARRSPTRTAVAQSLHESSAYSDLDS